MCDFELPENSQTEQDESSKDFKYYIECLWILVQIVAVIVAGCWSYNKWFKQEPALEPSVSAHVPAISSYWGNIQHDVCIISLHWTLKNNTKYPVDIDKIKFQLFYLENDYEFNFEGPIADFSADTLVDTDNYQAQGILAGEFPLTKNSGVIGAQSEISRDITVTFRPKSEKDNTNWFATHRIMGVVSAKYSNKNFPKAKDSIFKTSLQPVCHGNESDTEETNESKNGKPLS